MDLSLLVEKQNQFFLSGATRMTNFRVEQLKKMKELLIQNEKEIFIALKEDLGKPDIEILIAELGFVIQDINYMLKKIKKWNRPKTLKTPFILKPGRSQVYREPFGSVLVLSPWNYPLMLALVPVIGAIASGNTVVLKPSEMSPHVADLLAKIINFNFDPGFLKVITGGSATAEELTGQHFDYIFFTGSTEVGRKIQKAAAENLIPTTLELGGKSPCILDRNIDYNSALKRIVWGKFINAGQTCIAPDFLFVPQEAKQQVVDSFKLWVSKFYGEDPSLSPEYGRIINLRHFKRLKGLVTQGEILCGGKISQQGNYIEPTLIGSVEKGSDMLNNEIFGPVLPLLEYESHDDIFNFLSKTAPSLALYVFSNNEGFIGRLQRRFKSGAFVINDTTSQIMNPDLPFGGVGTSGMGAYHGRATYQTFTRPLSIYKKSRFELNFKYPPNSKKVLNSLKKMMLK